MLRRRCFPALLIASLVLLLPLRTLRADPVLPDFNPVNFTAGAPIDNPFFPLSVGTTFRWEATINDPEDGSTAHQVEQDFVTSQTKTVGGVLARVVHSTVHVDGEQEEDTLDYYAQDKFGNVWYLGEDTKSFERDDEGNIISTDTSGSWHAGINGAKPGFIMPNEAQLKVGFEYFQENAPADEALDQARIESLNESVTIPFGSFTDVLKTRESSSLEPSLHENKFYARGVGNILVEEDITSDGKVSDLLRLTSITHGGPAVIPLPPAAWTGMSTLALLLVGKGLRNLHRGRSRQPSS
jgi:hypothetical protein